MKIFVTGGSGFLGGRLIQALVARGDHVVALARSDEAARKVEALGATVARGDLDGVTGVAGCDAAIHSAAYVKELGTLAEFEHANVTGTKNVIAAVREAGVKRFVHVSTEAVLADGKPIVRADETRPIPHKHWGAYGETKARAEVLVRESGGIVVRPRLIWGRGDTSLMPQLLDAVSHKRFAWVGGGTYLTSTCNVANVVEGTLLALDKGIPGEVYFLTDGAPIQAREFLTKLFATQGVDPGNRKVPYAIAKLVARATSWMKRPPVTKAAFAVGAHEVTVDDSKARRELGYEGRLSVQSGLDEMHR